MFSLAIHVSQVFCRGREFLRRWFWASMVDNCHDITRGGPSATLLTRYGMGWLRRIGSGGTTGFHSMPLTIEILLLLVVARIAAEIAERHRQPAMIGEVAAGFILGPLLFALIGPSVELRAIADLGVLLLVVLAGMEIDTERLFQAFRGRNIWISIVGFTLPLLLGIFVGIALGLDLMRTIFIGLSIAITALPVSVRIPMDLGRVQTEAG